MPGAGQRPLIAVTAECEDDAEAAHVVSDACVVAVWQAGGLPVIVPSPPRAAGPAGGGPGAGVDADPRPGAERDPLAAAAAAVIDRAGGLLLTGGGDIDPYLFGQHPHPRLGRVTPRRDAWEIALVQAALAAGRPILGICRGAQILTVACGGTLVQDLDTQVPGAIQHRQKAPRGHPSHEVQIHDGTLLRRIAGAAVIRVNSRHHQAVREPGAGLVVSAVAPDGVVEAVEGSGGGFVVGVQWHPEDLAGAGWEDPVSRRLFRAFVEAAGAAPVGAER